MTVALDGFLSENRVMGGFAMLATRERECSQGDVTSEVSIRKSAGRVVANLTAELCQIEHAILARAGLNFSPRKYILGLRKLKALHEALIGVI